MPANAKEKILVVEKDPLIGDLIADQALSAAGYIVELVPETTKAIKKAREMQPDAIIVNLDMPGLSGKDLMIALTAQRIETPIIVLGQKGMEADIMQAYRLGAADYLLWPLREAEVINIVDRVLKQGRERKAKDKLARQYEMLTRQLQTRMREMKSLLAIGKAVISITDQTILFEQLLENVIRLTNSDSGWFLLKSDKTKEFHLAAYKNLPSSIEMYLNNPWDDGISYLVANSGKALSIEGEALKKFKVSTFGSAVQIVPVMVQNEVIALLVQMRKQERAYNQNDLTLASAIADYATISLVNSRLFQALEQRAKTHQTSLEQLSLDEKISYHFLEQIQSELKRPLDALEKDLRYLEEMVQNGEEEEGTKALLPVKNRLNQLDKMVEHILLQHIESKQDTRHTDLNALIRAIVHKTQKFIKPYQISILLKLPREASVVKMKEEKFERVFEGLLSNAIKFCNKGGRITVQIQKTADNKIHLSVQNSGLGISSKQIEDIFDGTFHAPSEIKDIFGGYGIPLPLIREMVEAENGKIWAESKSKRMSAFHVLLPAIF